MLKTVPVVPIYKSGVDINVNNYRLISILQILSKILEFFLINYATILITLNYYVSLNLVSVKAYQHSIEIAINYNMHMIMLTRVILLFIYFFWIYAKHLTMSIMTYCSIR